MLTLWARLPLLAALPQRPPEGSPGPAGQAPAGADSQPPAGAGAAPRPASTARGPHPSVPACATDPAPRPTGPLARARMPTVEGLLPRGPRWPLAQSSLQTPATSPERLSPGSDHGTPPPNTPGRNVPGHANGGRNPTPTHAVPCASRVRPATLVKLMPRAATGPRAAGARWVQRASLPGSPRA